MEVFLASVIPLLMALIYFLGLKTGKELAKEEKPVKQVKMTKKEKQEQAEVMSKFNNAWDNINNYDGTPESQKEVNL